MTFRWRADDGPLIVVLVSSLPSSKLDPSDKTFWTRACRLPLADNGTCLIIFGEWVSQSKIGGKDQESIQSSTTPGPGYHMGK